MAIPIKIPILLEDSSSATRARTLQLSETLIEVEGQTQRSAGESLGFALELTGFGSTLRGRAVVEKVFDPELGRGRCLLRVTQLAPHQQASYRAWLYEISLADGLPPEPSACPAHEQPPQRQSARDSLSSFTALAAGRERRRPKVTPVQPKPSAPTRRKRRRVEVRVAAAAHPPMVLVRYNDPGRYTQHYWEHLREDALRLSYGPAPLHPSAEVRVRIVLPGGATITCPGTVTEAEARALAIEIEPVDSDRALMQLSAGPEPLRR